MDVMGSYFIAQKNDKTGRFEISWREGIPDPFTKEQALKSFANRVTVCGTQNVKLFREVVVNVGVDVKIPESEKE